MQIAYLFILALGAFGAHCGELKHKIVLRSATDKSIDDDWWKTGIFYQIYPRSFMDSDGDGIGDLQGIISKLDHLVDMGVTATWLSPIYRSPDVDGGYDISDYRDVDPKYGNLTDLTELVEKAHALGIKVIMDFVPNHTSDQHKWFQEALKGNASYVDYYVWKKNTTEDLPNNWISMFGGSAWNYSTTRSQYYLHEFSWGQPDLNYSNPNVVKDMKAVLTYWMDLGIDGFRMDAVPYLFEHKDFPDEPRTYANGIGSTEPTYLRHVYTQHLDETYDMIYQFRSHLDDYSINYSRIMMTEAYCDTSEQTMAYYGNNTADGAHFTFNFNLISGLTRSFTIDDLIEVTAKWLAHLPKKYVSNWVLGNHDNHRVASRLGVDNVDAFNMFAAFMPGIQVVYMGEEIGMENGEVNCSQGYDPQAINNCSTFAALTRDFERTPYQWDESLYAGFTKGNSTWLPVSNKYKETNLKKQNVTGSRSHYNVFKSMTKFRKNFKNITYDAVSLIKLSDSVLQILRVTDKDEFVYLFNAGDGTHNVTPFIDNKELVVEVVSIDSQFFAGDVLDSSIKMKPHEALVLKARPHNGSASTITQTWGWSSILIVAFTVMMRQ